MNFRPIVEIIIFFIVVAIIIAAALYGNGGNNAKIQSDRDTIASAEGSIKILKRDLLIRDSLAAQLTKTIDSLNVRVNILEKSKSIIVSHYEKNSSIVRHLDVDESIRYLSNRLSKKDSI